MTGPRPDGIAQVLNFLAQGGGLFSSPNQAIGSFPERLVNQVGDMGQQARQHPLSFLASLVGPGEMGAVGSIHPDPGAFYRELLAKFAEPKRFDVPASITMLMRKHDNLGFQSRGEALNAVLKHPDWHMRWQMDDPGDVAALNKWRARTIGPSEPGARVVGSIGGNR